MFDFENIGYTISLVTMVIGMFLALHFLFLFQGNRKANLWLGIYLFFTSISVFSVEFESSYSNLFFIDLISIIDFQFIIVPALFFYFLSIIKSPKELKNRYYWLFLFLLIDPIFQTFLSFFSDSSYFDLISSYSYLIYLFIVSSFSLFIYFKILKLLKKHNKNILKFFSSIENKQFNWLKNLIIINICFTAIWFVDDALYLIFDENIISDLFSSLSFFGTFLTIVWIGFASLRQIPIYEDSSKAIEEDKPIVETENPDEFLLKYENVKNLVYEKEYFLEPNLTLKSLADLLSLKEKELTKIINLGFGNNFYHFINYYRIQHYKKLQDSPENSNFSIEGLSKDSGFNSKSTFYTAFKRLEGVTPKQYELNKNAYRNRKLN